MVQPRRTGDLLLVRQAFPRRDQYQLGHPRRNAFNSSRFDAARGNCWPSAMGRPVWFSLRGHLQHLGLEKG